MALQHFLSICIALIVLFCCYTISKYYIKQQKQTHFIHESIPVHLIDDTTTCSKILNKFIKSNPKIIGIDCEWVENNKVSLLQIANNQIIILIRLHLLSSIPIELIHLFGNIHVIKCGVGIKNDIEKLNNHYKISAVGCIELNNLYQHTTNDTTSSPFIGLNKLYKLLFGKAMKYKKLSITKSNWECDTLSNEQLHYAADDALAGYQIFAHLMKDHDTSVHFEYLYGIIDRFEAVKSTKQSIKSSKTNKCKKVHKKSKNLIRSNKRSNIGKLKKFDNCKILQPDGTLLGLCSKYALKIHLKDGMAIKVDEDTIKLKEAKTVKVQIFDEYIRTESPNLCFVCGERENLRKYAIFPIGYTKFIDKTYYDRSCFHHDNILLCLLCNQKAQKLEIEFKQLLCDKHESVPHFQISTKLWYAIKCAKTLKPHYWRVRIPVDKQIRLLEEVLGCLDVQYDVIYNEADGKDNHLVYGFVRENCVNVAAECILKTCLSFCINKNDVAFDKLIRIKGKEGESEGEIHKCIDYLVTFNKRQLLQSHCKELIEQFDGRHKEFIQMWRDNFLQNMNPRFLPQHW